MKKIKINFVDFWSDFDPNNNNFINALRKFYDVELSNSPDYIFYSVFGREHLNYNCIRIFYTGECVTPDFNTCDYAMGYDFIDFGDRYCRVPLYYLGDTTYRDALEKHKLADVIIRQKRGFCSFVVSNAQGQPQRRELFELLSAYKKVASGGSFLNNIGYCVPDRYEFERQFKFSIAFENTCYPGYTTEKIIEAFRAGTVPIYFGNPRISEDFNEQSFVNCHAFSDFSEVVDLVIKIDQDDDLRKRYLSTPIAKGYRDFGFEKFLISIFDQDLDHAKRRPVRAISSWWRTIKMDSEMLLGSIMSYCQNQFVGEAAKDTDVYKFISEIHALTKVHDIITPGVKRNRVSKTADGGCVMVKPYSRKKIAYSFGSERDDSWDLQMADEGYQIYQYNRGRTIPSVQNEAFHWTGLGVTGKSETDTLKNLQTLIRENGHKDESGMVLKMDIGGHEWSVFANADADTLEQFDQIICKFHFFNLQHDMFDKRLSAFRKLAESFVAVHVHINKCGGIYYCGDLMLPMLLELAFIKKDLFEVAPGITAFPTFLYDPNDGYHDVMIERW